jgi:predicted PurR-regulated permease PerM
MAAIGPPLSVPEGRPNRRFFATAALVVIAVLLGVIALLLGLWIVRETIVWLVAAGFLAFSIEPLIRIFTRRGIGRGAATALSFTIIAVVILIFSFAIIPSVVNGAKALKDHIPAYVDQLQDTDASDALNADQAIESTGNAAAGSSSFFSGSGRVLDFIGGLVHSGFAVFMIFTFTLYFLVYGRDLVHRASGLMPAAYRQPFVRATRSIFQINKGYWYGKFLIGVIAGVTTFVTMKLLGLPYAAPLALFVGITDLIPNIGATLGTIPVVIVGLLEEPWKGVVAGVVLILYQQVENNLITPKIFKETVEIHPFVSVVAVIVFTSLFGIVGALIAVPVTKAIEILYAAFREGRGAEVNEAPLPEPE